MFQNIIYLISPCLSILENYFNTIFSIPGFRLSISFSIHIVSFCYHLNLYSSMRSCKCSHRSSSIPHLINDGRLLMCSSRKLVEFQKYFMFSKGFHKLPYHYYRISQIIFICCLQTTAVLYDIRNSIFMKYFSI